MSSILCLIPANVLHKVVRYVCKHWNGLVSDPVFIRAHSQLSSTGFLIQTRREIDQACYIESDNGRLKEVSIVQIPFPAKIKGSVNGFVLLRDLTNTAIFHVMNLVTKVKVTLPPVVGYGKYKSGASVGVDSSGRCKVVHVDSIFCELQSLQFSLIQLSGTFLRIPSCSHYKHVKVVEFKWVMPKL